MEEGEIENELITQPSQKSKTQKARHQPGFKVQRRRGLSVK